MWDLQPMHHRAVRIGFYSHSPLWFRLLGAARIHKNKRMTVKFASVDEALWLLARMRDLDSIVDAYRRIAIMRHSTIPITILQGTREPISSKRSMAKFYQEFALAPEDVIKLDPQIGNQEELIRAKGPCIQGYMVQNGGHFAYAKHKEYAFRIIENLLNYQQNNN